MFYFNDTERSHELWSVGIMAIMDRNDGYKMDTSHLGHAQTSSFRFCNVHKFSGRSTYLDASSQQGEKP
jgi:hypothetical protein